MKALVISTVPSQSSNKSYTLTAHADGVVSCSCPAWKFQKVTPAERVCKHMRAFGVLNARQIAAKVAAA